MRRALLALLLLAALPAQAADPLRLVSGFAPGGPTDQLARIMAPVLGQLLDRPVVIEIAPARARPSPRPPWRERRRTATRC